MAELWNPKLLLNKLNIAEAHYSKGFLRSKPEKWFPNFLINWSNLLQKFSLDTQFLKTEVLLNFPGKISKENSFIAKIDNEELVLSIDDASVNVLKRSTINDLAGNLLIELFVRRFFYFLTRTWSGHKINQSSFVGHYKQDQKFSAIAYIRLHISINGQKLVLMIAIQQGLLDKLDGLWRRQLLSTTRTNIGEHQLTVELAKFRREELSKYKKGDLIPIENFDGRKIRLLKNNQAWIVGILSNLNDKLSVIVSQILPSINDPNPQDPDELSIQYGSITKPGYEMAEVLQPGAVMETDLELSSKAQLIGPNNEAYSIEMYYDEGTGLFGFKML